MKFKIILAMLFLGTSAFGLAYAEDEHAGAQCAEPLGAHGCKTTIQAAIDAASPGNTIDVYPGNYTETASDRTLASIGGAYQFGLFIGLDRSGITIRGVDTEGERIDNYREVKAFIETNSTSNFGPSGIFVEGDGVTISGLGIGVNLIGQNKTIEVIGDDFTLSDCDISDIGGSVYINEFSFDTIHNSSHLRSYRIEGNNFQDGVSIDIANGAGFSGPVKGRVIKKNKFANSNYWPSISFNGSDTGVEWFIYAVGGAVIRDNTFVNTFTFDPDEPWQLLREGHIRARGTYDNSQFDWKMYFNENKFDNAYATGPKPPKDLRTYSYTSGSYVFNNIRRIGALLEGEQAIAQPGDKIKSKD